VKPTVILLLRAAAAVAEVDLGYKALEVSERA
jgi:hypothetical protein